MPTKPIDTTISEDGLPSGLVDFIRHLPEDFDPRRYFDLTLSIEVSDISTIALFNLLLANISENYNFAPYADLIRSEDSIPLDQITQPNYPKTLEYFVQNNLLPSELLDLRKFLVGILEKIGESITYSSDGSEAYEEDEQHKLHSLLKFLLLETLEDVIYLVSDEALIRAFEPNEDNNKPALFNQLLRGIQIIQIICKVVVGLTPMISLSEREKFVLTQGVYKLIKSLRKSNLYGDFISWTKGGSVEQSMKTIKKVFMWQQLLLLILEGVPDNCSWKHKALSLIM